MFTKILCPFDGSDHGRKALELAIDLSKTYGAKLVIQHNMLLNAHASDIERFASVEGLGKTVQPELSRLKAVEGRLNYGFEEPPADTPRIYAEIGQNLLDGAKEEAREKGVANAETVLSSGDAATRILQCADDKGVDCIVMGSRGLSDVRALYLGSVSHKVLNRAPCTCIAVK